MKKQISNHERLSHTTSFHSDNRVIRNSIDLSARLSKPLTVLISNLLYETPLMLTRLIFTDKLLSSSACIYEIILAVA
jgi:hypothetical protein